MSLIVKRAEGPSAIPSSPAFASSVNTAISGSVSGSSSKALTLFRCIGYKLPDESDNAIRYRYALLDG